MSRRDPLFPNTWIVARREYVERIRSRLFYVSTLFLATLAVLIAFAPIFVKVLDQGTTTRVSVVASDPVLAERAVAIMEGVLNAQSGGTGAGSGGNKPYLFMRGTDRELALADVAAGRVDGALIAQRGVDGGIDFQFFTGEGMGADRAQLVGVGTLAVAILDWTSTQQVGAGFVLPTLEVIAGGGPSAGGAPISSAEYTGRRILGIVFVVMIFLLMVVYGMWVAAGVVAEKTSRVMELIVAAASARQLLAGKVVGIGLAGFTQYACVLLPALGALAIQEQLSEALFGAGESVAPSLAALTPGLLAAYAGYFVLGFALYGLIYAAVGSLVSRPEDLQVISLPMSLVAVFGYLIALLSLSGGAPGLTRFASFVPFWSPFVMTTRLTVSRVEPIELVVSFGLLVVAIGVTLVLSTRVYAAGVLLYGQRPGFMAVVRAIREG